MCTLVFTEDKTIKTVRELCKLLGTHLAHNCVKPLADGDCLCWVDVPASAEKAGWIAEHDDFGFKLGCKEK